MLFPPLFGRSSVLKLEDFLTTSARLYTVRISELDDDDESWLGPAYTSAAHVATVTVVAWSRREAAARAYVRTPGQAPGAGVGQASGTRVYHPRRTKCCAVLSRGLEKAADWAGPCYRLFNMVQTWHLRVTRLPLSRAAKAQLAAHHGAKGRHRRRLLNAGQGLFPN